MTARWDAVVVGAGPAGSTAARLLARGGHAVLLVERARFPRPKVCGGCLNAAGLAVLRDVGLGELPDRLGAVRLQRLRLHSAGRAATIVTRGASISRERLDAALLEAALAAGASVLEGTRAVLEGQDADGVAVRLEHGDGVERVRAAAVVVAAGLAARFADDEDGLVATPAAASRIGGGALAERAPEWLAPGVIVMCHASGGYVGMVRVEDGRLDVAAAFDPALVKERGGLAGAAGSVIERAGGRLPEGIGQLAWRGTPQLTFSRARVASGRVLLVGDAAGYVEPFTGEGMAWALATGRDVVPCVADALAGDAGAAERWQRRWSAGVGRRQAVCRGVAAALRRPALTRFAVGALGAMPFLAAPVVLSINAPLAPGPT